MTLRDDLEKVIQMGHEPPSKESITDFMAHATIFLRDHGKALLEAVRDAERYRWLRDAGDTSSAVEDRFRIFESYFDEALDKAIDEAMEVDR